jgi:hypothetical protein
MGFSVDVVVWTSADALLRRILMNCAAIYRILKGNLIFLINLLKKFDKFFGFG